MLCRSLTIDHALKSPLTLEISLMIACFVGHWPCIEITIGIGDFPHDRLRCRTLGRQFGSFMRTKLCEYFFWLSCCPLIFDTYTCNLLLYCHYHYRPFGHWPWYGCSLLLVMNCKLGRVQYPLAFWWFSLLRLRLLCIMYNNN
jgi:hypothetical protein